MYGLNPVRFNPTSQVTTTLGVNDGSIGDGAEDSTGKWLLVYNDNTASVPVGYGMVLNAGATGYSCTVSSATSADMLIGVVVNTSIVSAGYGWVLQRGFCNVQMGAASGTVLTKGTLQLGAAGLFFPKSNATGSKDNVVGCAMATIVTSASGPAFISVF